MPIPHPLSDFTVFEQLHIRCWVGSFSSCAVNTRPWSLLRGNPTSNSKLLATSLPEMPWRWWGGGREFQTTCWNYIFPWMWPAYPCQSPPEASVKPSLLQEALEPLLVPYEATQAGASVGISSHCELQTRKESVCADFFKKRCLMQDNTDFPEKKCRFLRHTIFNASIFKWVTI